MIESAFPWTVDNGEKIIGNKGMNLRDYFAAKALEVAIYQVKDYYEADKNVVAKWCYEMADAMLEARKA